MDGRDLLGTAVIGLVLGAGLASFALAGLAGGALASIGEALAVGGRRARRGSRLVGWVLVGLAGATVGVVAFAGLIVLGDAVEPALDGLPLVPATWAASALAGAVGHITLVAGVRRAP